MLERKAEGSMPSKLTFDVLYNICEEASLNIVVLHKFNGLSLTNETF